MVTIHIDIEPGQEPFLPLAGAVQSAMREAAALAALAHDAQVDLLVVDETAIQELNREHRGVDSATDVLSFPLVADMAAPQPTDFDPQSSALMLGDIVLSLPAAQRQARQYGHSLQRELAYLSVHGLLHLLGYDHQSDEQRACMRALEEQALERGGLTRDTPGVDQAELVRLARLAREQAYAPYSGFRVGACLQSEQGARYIGCNVESVSFTPTCCAERTALFSAVAAGERRFAAIAVACDGSRPAWPCGVCRQALMEFSPDMLVIAAGQCGEGHAIPLRELLPQAFTEYKEDAEDDQ